MTDRDEEAWSLGSWVRRRRKALDMTQAALADRVGCAVVTIRKIEQDAMRPSRVMAERLARCLALPPDEQAVFLQVACGERSVRRLPLPLASADLPRPVASEPSQRWPAAPGPLPRPAPLPSGSRMPLSRNPLFVGRESDLRQLAAVLHAGDTGATGHLEIAAATGLGGIGKTQLACEFVHRYGHAFAGGVFWLSFADPAAIPAEVAACGGGDGMDLSPEFDTLPLDTQVQRVLAAWKQPLPRLLVFDTCEDEALLLQWRPTHGGCRVLITSRRHHWDAALGVQTCPLDVLPRAESLMLLRQFRPDLAADDADLERIGAALGDLPLALHLAGSFLAKYRHAITPAHYLERLQGPTLLDDRSLQAAGVSPTLHVQHVARTFAQSYERLDPADPTDALARTLLAHAACFAPGEPVPRSLLLQTLDRFGDDPDRRFLAEDALTRLVDLGLLDITAEGALRLHRLVATFAHALLVDATARAAVEATMLRVIDELNASQNPRSVLAVQPHLRWMAGAAQPRADARSAALGNALGYHLWQLGVYPEAQGYLEQALAIRQRLLGPDHPDTAMSLHNLGNVVKERGHYTEAQGYLEQALAIRQRLLGPDHPQTTQSLNNLAVVFYHQGQYSEAQGYLEQALAIRQRCLGPDHPQTARSFNNLGVLLRAQGQYAEAQRCHAQALAIRQRVLGTNHPETAYSFNNLGDVLQAQGQYAEAQQYYAQALVIREHLLGTNHPETARSFHSLGEVLRDQGQYRAAQGSLEQALAIRQRVLGADHPDTARSLRSLGELLYAHGETTLAHQYLEQAVAIFAHRLGPHHPDTEQTRRALVALVAGHVIADSGCDQW
ncbi:MAG TPA: FxSxx-COOH system tetratricopeptide repeat protein [Herpetosiphonaceae bacterium]